LLLCLESRFLCVLFTNAVIAHLIEGAALLCVLFTRAVIGHLIEGATLLLCVLFTRAVIAHLTEGAALPGLRVLRHRTQNIIFGWSFTNDVHT
jgi:hypothetical protein